MFEALILAWNQLMRKVPPAPPAQESFRLLGHDPSEKIWFQFGTFYSEEALRLEAIATLRWMRERGIEDRLYLQTPEGSLEWIWRDERAVLKEA